MEIEKVDQQPKKQIRRRLHNSKPYQERLMNMAEARKEIAIALKFHRASMKQQESAVAANYHYPQSLAPQMEQQQRQQGKSNFAHYPSTPTANSYWPMSTIVPPPPPQLNLENLNLILPNQTLGLNLNYKDFNNLNTRIYHNSMPAIYSSSAASTSSAAVVEYSGVTQGGLEINENGAEEDRTGSNSHDDDGYHHPFEQVMEFPPWLINANETSSFHHLSDHHFSDEYSPDPALPCMDIGEIEGMDDGEWLA